MYKLVLLVFAIPFFCQQIMAQRTCGSTLDLADIERNTPHRYQRILELDKQFEKYLETQGDGAMKNVPTIIRIPVVVHVLHNGEPVGSGRNISMAQIESQIDVLNEDFRRLNSDAVNTPTQFQTVAADVGLEFHLACIDQDGNPTNGVVRKMTSDSSFSQALDNIKFDSQGGSNAWATDRYLIYGWVIWMETS